MKDLLLAYQLLSGIGDALAGTLLIVAPVFTLRFLGLPVSTAAEPYLTLIGAFMLSVGLVYLYGATLVRRTGGIARLEAVWLLTAMIRSSASIFVLDEVLQGTLPTGWLALAIFDGICVAIQARGLRQGWLAVTAPDTRDIAVR